MLLSIIKELNTHKYIALTLLTAAISLRSIFCYYCFEAKNFRTIFIILLFPWFILPIVYTIRTTVSDIDPIPFICPSNYPYAFKIIETIL
ncbi:hypothetical protein F8M41_017106 [Gigaspora margarita]|uniref:Uncharacterized protein n=1 Tax=Gigaspora margarita TaxID=4874 RepID=A0A8H4ANR3_GIGMA|nr:hypothetical protein F8M41_017106 [Gigaspora margarita]